MITAGWLLLFSQSLWDNFSTSRKTIHEICLGIIPSFGVNKSHPWRESVLTWQAGTSTIYGWYSWDNHGISNHLPSGVSHLACHHLVRWTFSQLIIYITGWWLSHLPLWKMMDVVSWDDYAIPNIWKTCSKPPTSIILLTYFIHIVNQFQTKIWW